MSEADNRDSVQFQVVWSRAGSSSMVVWPKREDADCRFFITNDISNVGALIAEASLHNWFVVDAYALCSVLYPEATQYWHNALDNLKDVEELWRIWQECASRLDFLPHWVLDTVAALAVSIDEVALAKLFSRWHDDHLNDGEVRPWFDSFKATVKRVERPSLPTLDDCTPLDVSSVSAYLEEGGMLSRLVDGYEPRPGQIQMLRAVVDAFNQGHHLISEAGTGIGKSLAYLLPAALWAKLNDVPVVISTNTKNLQSQLIQKDLPAVLRMISEARAFPGMPELASAIIKGRTNYLCLRRLSQLMDEGVEDTLSNPEIRMLIATVVWVVTTPDGDLDALTGSGAVEPSFLSMLTCSSDECRGRGCKLYHRCFIQKARERALRANLIIANHSLVFSELGLDSPISIPKYSQIVFDEAHNLEESATAHFTLTLSPSSLASVLNRIAQQRGKRSRGALYDLKRRYESGAFTVLTPDEFENSLADAFVAVKNIYARSDVFFKELYALVSKSDAPLRYRFEPVAPDAPLPAPDKNWENVRIAQAAFTEAQKKLLELLDNLIHIVQGDLSGELNLAAGDVTELRSAVSRVEELINATDIIMSGSDDSYVFWIERSHGPGALAEASAAPLEVGEFLNSSFYNRCSSVIFCSATLSAGGRFDYIFSRLGINRIPKERLAIKVSPSPFDYFSQSSLLVPMYLPEPEAQDRSYIGELSNLVLQLAKHYGGRTLVLFTSYEMMRRSAELLRAELQARGLGLLVQGESGSRDRITGIFRQMPGNVLFGTHSFWEGVDIQGEALSCVVIARLPFAAPTDPINSARCEQIADRGGKPFYDFSLPMTALKLRQGFGRLIRHRLDRGTVIIADTRFVTKSYGGFLRKSMPLSPKKCFSAEEIFGSLK